MNSVYKKKAPVFAFGYAEADKGTEAEGRRERHKGRFLTSEFLNTHL